MKVLVLGGTLFVGRHVVEAAQARGHRVTIFTRGRTNPELFPDVERLHGDRGGDLHALRGRAWDAVVDTSAYLPRHAAASATALAKSIGRYCLISTGVVYAAFPEGGAAEDTETHAPLDADDVTLAAYGPLKVGCERAVLAAVGEQALIVRPGVLVGPHDPTHRLGYWVARVRDGGEVLAPGDPGHPLQLLDARDLARWLIGALERGSAGVFNASGPTERLTMGAMLETCVAVANGDARLTWAPDAFLLGQGVTPWSDLPLWLPGDTPGPLLDSGKARADGLRSRPFADTVHDVLHDAGLREQSPSGPARPSAIGRERERELLRRLHATAHAVRA